MDVQGSWQLQAPIPPQAPVHLHQREEQHRVTPSPTRDPVLLLSSDRGGKKKKKKKSGMRCLISLVTKGWRSPSGVERRCEVSGWEPHRSFDRFPSALLGQHSPSTALVGFARATQGGQKKMLKFLISQTLTIWALSSSQKQLRSDTRFLFQERGQPAGLQAKEQSQERTSCLPGGRAAPFHDRRSWETSLQQLRDLRAGGGVSTMILTTTTQQRGLWRATYSR